MQFNNNNSIQHLVRKGHFLPSLPVSFAKLQQMNSEIMNYIGDTRQIDRCGRKVGRSGFVCCFEYCGLRMLILHIAIFSDEVLHKIKIKLYLRYIYTIRESKKFHILLSFQSTDLRRNIATYCNKNKLKIVIYKRTWVYCTIMSNLKFVDYIYSSKFDRALLHCQVRDVLFCSGEFLDLF